MTPLEVEEEPVPLTQEILRRHTVKMELEEIQHLQRMASDPSDRVPTPYSKPHHSPLQRPPVFPGLDLLGAPLTEELKSVENEEMDLPKHSAFSPVQSKSGEESKRV